MLVKSFYEKRKKMTKSNFFGGLFLSSRVLKGTFASICELLGSTILSALVADLGFWKGGFRFRRITVKARIVSSWQGSMSMQRLRSRSPSARSAENSSELRTFEIASAGFSGPIQRALVRRSSKLPHLFHRPCGADSFLLLMA